MLGLTQPTISRNIAYVENRLGESLFIKGKRPLHPTLLGQLLAPHGQVIMEVSRKASESAQSFQEGSAGGVQVCGGAYFMDALNSDLIASFQHIEPDIRIDLSYGYLTELMMRLNANQIDLAIGPLGMRVAGSDVDSAHSERP